MEAQNNHPKELPPAHCGAIKRMYDDCERKKPEWLIVTTAPPSYHP